MANSTEPIKPSGLDLCLDPATGRLRARRYSVKVLTGSSAGRELTLSGKVRVGSHSEVELPLTDPTVSRLHLELEPRPGGVRAVDLGSTNGTLLGGARIQEIFIQTESTLVVGNTKLRVSIHEEDLEISTSSRSFGPLVGESPASLHLFALLERAAATDVTLLIVGESGTGKGLIARAVHDASPRRAGPFVVVDCRALVSDLVESALFGHVAGAFTDARSDRRGAFLEADGGTLFLDGIGELPLDLQPKLLRALESGVIQRLGEDRPRRVNVRLLASASTDLEERIRAGLFRSDLYFRLAVVPLEVPPLRDRHEDIPPLVRHFLQELGQPDLVLSEQLRVKLVTYGWPGNVRELRNVVERVVALGTDRGPSELPARAGASSQSSPDVLPFKLAKDRLLNQFIREYVVDLRDRCGGNVSEMARVSGLTRNHLYNLMSKLDLDGGKAQEDE